MKYAVQVNYRTHRGNASSRTFVVEANSEPEAVEIANGKARKHPNVQSIVGGDVVEVFSPAPTDWGKEFTRLTEMREKAISEMQNHIPQGRACTLSIPSRHGHIITVLNLPDNGIGFVTEESNITLWPHKVDTEYLFQAAYAVASTTFN